MPRLSSTCSFLLSLALMGVAPTQAQAPDPAQMQRMMEGVQAMQQCLARIDEKTLRRLEQRGEQMEREIDSLCAAGKRDEAQRRAIAMGVEFMNDPAARQMNACAKQAQELVPSMASATSPPFADPDARSAGHVCDQRD